MSTGTGGEVAIIPALIFGTVGAAVVIAGGGVLLAVNAYLKARDNINRELETARLQQSLQMNRDVENWKIRLQASYRAPECEPTKYKPVEEIIAEATPLHIPSSGLKDAALLDAMIEQEVIPLSPERPVIIEDSTAKQAAELDELLENVTNMMQTIDFVLPKEIQISLDSLYREENLANASAKARKIRVDVSSEQKRIEGVRQQEMQDARAILDTLPLTYPAEARAVLAEAVEGRIGFDATMKHAALEMIEKINSAAAAQVLQKSFIDLGYDVGNIENSLFAEGGEVYLRKGEWEDGYCVKMWLKDKRYHFFLQKTDETSAEYDKDMKKLWCETDLPELQKKLKETVCELSVKETEGHTIQGVKKITIPTKKKKTVVKEKETTSTNNVNAEQERCL